MNEHGSRRSRRTAHHDALADDLTAFVDVQDARPGIPDEKSVERSHLQSGTFAGNRNGPVPVRHQVPTEILALLQFQRYSTEEDLLCGDAPAVFDSNVSGAPGTDEEPLARVPLGANPADNDTAGSVRLAKTVENRLLVVHGRPIRAADPASLRLNLTAAGYGERTCAPNAHDQITVQNPGTGLIHKDIAYGTRQQTYLAGVTNHRGPCFHDGQLALTGAADGQPASLSQVPLGAAADRGVSETFDNADDLIFFIDEGTTGDDGVVSGQGRLVAQRQHPLSQRADEEHGFPHRIDAEGGPQPRDSENARRVVLGVRAAHKDHSLGRNRPPCRNRKGAVGQETDEQILVHHPGIRGIIGRTDAAGCGDGL